MNNPALPMYASQSPAPYAYSSPQPGSVFSTAPGTPFDHAQSPFQPGMIPNHLQKPSHPQQIPQQIPQHLYQQHPGQAGQFARPEGRSTQSPQNTGRTSNGPTPVPLIHGANQALHATQPQPPATSAQSVPASTAPTELNMAANMGLPQQANPSLVQQAQIQNAAQMARAAPPQQQQGQPGSSSSPQSTARERARVTILLEINTHLLQEVVSLQSQGKAGSTPAQAQQSPTSPSSAADSANALTNSPSEPPKSAGGTNQSKPPSQEYADCMRRLQANLSYLAAIADAKKKVNGALPPGPAIMAPPAHLPQVHDLYKKLNALFPEAGQSAVSKAMAYAASQNQGGATKTPHAVQG